MNLRARSFLDGKSIYICFEIQISRSLRASSPIWASEVSRAKTRERAAKPRGAGSLARSREARFACPNRRACSQTKFRALDSFCHIGNGEIFCGLLFFFFCVRVFLFCQLISRTVFVFFDLGGVHVWTIKNCKADCISSRLAGYWEKFSISNNHASDEPHWLR